MQQYEKTCSSSAQLSMAPNFYLYSSIIFSSSNFYPSNYLAACMVAQMLKNLPAMPETQGQEDPLEKGMATTPVFLSG